MHEAEFELEAELENLMGILAEADLESEARWETEDDAPIGLVTTPCTPGGTRVKSFACGFYDVAAIANFLRVGVTPDILRAAVEQAAAGAVTLAKKAAASLDNRTATSRAAFCAAFGITPDFVPDKSSPLRRMYHRWRDIGQFVMINLEDVAAMLECTDYCCWSQCPTGDDSVALDGTFWQAWKARDTVTMDLYLIRAILDRSFRGFPTLPGMVANSYCYQSFVARINGLPIPSTIIQKCPAGSCGSLPPVKTDPLDRFGSDSDKVKGPYHMLLIKQAAKLVVESWKTATPIKAVQLTGHTDSTFQGPKASRDRYNFDLGMRRAQAGQEAMKAAILGLDPAVAAKVEFMPLISRGAGDPKADNTTEEGRALNRRVEITLFPG
jgi:hypothetical protein